MRPRLKQLTDYLVFLAVRIFIAVLQSLPLGVCTTLARRFAYLMNDVVGMRRKVIDDNLRHAFPEWSAEHRRGVARAMWENLFLMIIEIAFVSRKLHWTNWRRYLHLKNDDLFIRAMLDDRPVLALSAHYGNFEIGNYVNGLFDFATYVVARTLDNPYIDKYLVTFRGRNGSRILPKQGSADTIARILDDGAALVTLGDQAAGPKGCWVEFFGRPASTHKAPAVFCLANDAPMLVVYTRRVGNQPLHFEVVTHAVADPHDDAEHVQSVAALTEWYTKQLEDIVRVAPEQYWWLHRRWKGEPRRARKKKAA